jgi:hypothetical protein
MKFFIDTEFDGFKGKLISFAMVSDAGEAMYCVFCDYASDPWVRVNVMPLIYEKSVISTTDKYRCAQLIAKAFSAYDEVEVFADWPTDIQHFCDLIEFKGGETLNMPKIKFTLDWQLSSKDSKVPHNAFHDAIAIAESYKSART